MNLDADHLASAMTRGAAWVTAGCARPRGAYVVAVPHRTPGLGPIDHVYAALRAGALLVGVAYIFLAKPGGGARDDVPIAFAAFATYGAVLYAAGLSWLRDPARKGRFYAVLGGFDLLFVIVLMHLTGGETSPFYRALYLWVAMPAFYFGLRAGTIASAVAFLVFVGIFDTNTHNAWDFLVRAGGLLLHGPVIGYLVARDHDRDRHIALLEAQLQQAQPKPGPGSDDPAA